MKAETGTSADIGGLMDDIGIAVRKAAGDLALSDAASRDGALQAAASAIRSDVATILQANQEDLDAARQRNLAPAMLDRLMLDKDRVAAIAAGIEQIAAMPDPLGRVLAEWQRPNGLEIQRVSVPLGVVGIIYESRPNVTADAAALCIKSGNAVILRGGSESVHSSAALYECIRQGLQAARLPVDAVRLVPTTDRRAVGYMLSSMARWIDVVVPRGGKSLVRRVATDARVPVIGHLDGVCHVYVHAAADIPMACEIVQNAKMRRTGICGAAETILVDAAIAKAALPEIARELLAAGCAIRGDVTVQSMVAGASAATDDDWSTEYLDAVVSIAVVADIDAAIAHIRQYGSGHTDAIVTEDKDAAERFFRDVDSAIVLHNASTQFADGGEFGMGAEIGIATGRVHARGPVGANELTSYKYVVRGKGQIRP